MATCSPSGTGNVMILKDFECIFGNIVSALLGLAGIVFFVIFIVGGFKFITSSGDPKKVASAQQTLTHAVLGLIFVSVSYLILVIIESITGVNVTNFSITII